jgi:multicomponent Na+:H+ antiporter subunit D
MIAAQTPILILLAPLFSGILITIFAQKSKNVAFFLLILGMVGSFSAACNVLLQVLQGSGPIHYRLGDWPPPFGIELVIDHLSGMVLFMVSGAALLTAIYSKHTVEVEIPDRIHHYYTLYTLLVSGLLGMVATGDVFNLYVLLEISALSSYALLARGRGLAYIATFKYIIIGTIGASFYLLGVGYLYIKTGTLNMADLSTMLATPEMHQSPSIKIGFIFIILGIWIKMAFFPLQGWLPNAYSCASTTTSCLIAPLMTKVSVYIMIRLMFSVFSADYIFKTLQWQQFMVWMACIAIVVGSVSALAQRNLKRMLCYIVVAEVGYMVGGVWLANSNGFSGAVYHIMSDVMMTLCLFMAVGAVTYKTGETSLEAMRGIFRRMPITAAAFLVGGFSIIGIPPTCGFFSKWYLITGAIETGQFHFVIALLFSSLINAILFFRIIEIGFFSPFDENGHATHQVIVVNEAPAMMLVPMVISAASLIIIGLYTRFLMSNIVQWTIPVGL